MSHSHEKELRILDKVHNAELNKGKLNSHDVEELLNLFVHHREEIKGQVLENQIRFLTRIIQDASNDLKDTKLHKIVSFVLLREKEAYDNSDKQTSKNKHEENIAMLKRISQSVHDIEPLVIPKRRH